MMSLKGVKIKYCKNDGSFILCSESYKVNNIPAKWKDINANKRPLEKHSSIVWGNNGGTLTVTEGFRWDITDPTYIFRRSEKLAKAAMVHDVLYNAITCRVVKRKCVGEVNDLFDDHMKCVGFLWRKPVIWAVRLAVRIQGRPISKCWSGGSRFTGTC